MSFLNLISPQDEILSGFANRTPTEESRIRALIQELFHGFVILSLVKKNFLLILIN